jgi:hypothetical protein
MVGALPRSFTTRGGNVSHSHRKRKHRRPDGPGPTSCEIREVEALVAPLRREIARQGWTIAGMAADGGRPPWMHTVGLVPRFDHPELIVVDLHELGSELLLTILAMRVAAGETFDHDSVVVLDGIRLELGWVHPRHFELDTFGMWEPLMEMHSFHFDRRALQVFVPDTPDEAPKRRRALNRPVPIR